MKFLALIEERSGDYEFNSKIVVEAADLEAAWECAQSLACSWRGNGTAWDVADLPRPHAANYELCGGEIMASVEDVKGPVETFEELLSALGGAWDGYRCEAPGCERYGDYDASKHTAMDDPQTFYCWEHIPAGVNPGLDPDSDEEDDEE